MDEPNEIARERDRAALLEASRNNTASNRLAASSGGRGVPTSPISLRTAFYGLLIGGALIFIVVGAVVIAKQSGNVAGFYAPGSDCTVVTCPAGERGPTGPTGPAGPPGPATVGPSGASGPSGPKGDTGGTGSPGMCLGNSACERGLTGDTGAKGNKGAKGGAGDIGPPGDTGDRGPQGVQGTTGQKGAKGDVGAGVQGIKGNAGTCDCSSTLPLSTFVGLNVTGAVGTTTTLLNVTQEIVCSNGATIGAACLRLTGACPDFSPCWLNMTALSVNEGGNVGVNISSFSLSTFSKSGDGMRVQFGDKNTMNSMVTEFDVYATELTITCQDLCEIESYATPISISTFNSSDINIASDGQLTCLAQNTILYQSTSNAVQMVGENGAATWNVGFPTQTVSGFAQSLFSMDTPNFIFRSNQGQATPYIWISTNSTFTYNTLPGLTNTTITPLTPANQAATINVYGDIALIGGANVIGTADGFVPMSGIKSGRNNLNVLIIQNGTLTQFVDIRAFIQNRDPTFQPVVFNQEQGVDFLSTPIYNTDPGSPLECNDTEGFLITSGILILGAPGGAQVTMTVSGTAGSPILTFTPPALTFVGSATNSISDERVKQNITIVAPEDDLRFVLDMPKRVSYQLSEMVDADNQTVRHGYLAQELEKHAPQMVHSAKRVLRDGTTVMEDFRTVDLMALVPRLAGALEAMYERQLVLEARIKKLERKFRNFL